MNITDLDLAKLSQLAYTSKPTWTKEDVNACLTKTSDGQNIIAFRGTTKDPQDWVRDLETWPRWHPDLGFVHDGFLSGAELVIDQIKKDVGGTKIILTGHSLGGALAIVVAALLEKEFPGTIFSIITFGAPKVGSRKLRRILNSIIIRQYRHALDPITEVPPTLFGLYFHQRPLLSIIKHGELITVNVRL